MVFAPATRVAYNLSPTWAVAVEHYGELGQLRGFSPVSQQSHQIFGVFNHKTKFVDIEAGVGIGVTASSDKVTLKLLLSREKNPKRTE